MFEDQRSKRVVLVAHCVLNQNAKIDGCGRCPGAIPQVVQPLVEAGVGIIQMPCPELLALGLDRQADPDHPRTIESEDTRVADRMAHPAAQSVCATIVSDLVYQIQEYRKHGFTVAGVIGMNGSPTCGVETTWRDGEEQPGRGVLLEALSRELDRAGLRVPFRGVKAQQPEEAKGVVERLLNANHP